MGGDILASIGQKLEKICQKIAQEAISNAVNDIAFDIENMYQTVIDQFYNDYSPTKYSRTYSGYEAYIKHIKKIRNGYECGIIVDGSKIPQGTYSSIYNHNPVDSSFVFERTFERGLHGNYITDIYSPSQMSPAPKEQMDKLFQEYKNSGQLKSIFNHSIKFAMKKIK